MALIVQVTVTNDETGEVEKTFVDSFYMGRSSTYELADGIRSLMGRVFQSLWPGSDEW